MNTNIIKTIYSKEFLKELEQRISESQNVSFKDFTKSLWFFLCSLKWNENQANKYFDVQDVFDGERYV